MTALAYFRQRQPRRKTFISVDVDLDAAVATLNVVGDVTTNDLDAGGVTVGACK